MLPGMFANPQLSMIRTNNAAKKSARAIATGTVVATVYAWVTDESLIGPLMMGVSAMVGICTFLFYYSKETSK